MVDFDALQAAGIADARGRAALIEYLAGLGFSPEEMVDAERRGRLFGLAGDAVQLTGPPIHSLTTAADALGLPVAEVARAWAALGLTVAGPDEFVLSQADVDGLAPGPICVGRSATRRPPPCCGWWGPGWRGCPKRWPR